jgi:hypothetical protein
VFSVKRKAGYSEYEGVARNGSQALDKRRLIRRVSGWNGDTGTEIPVGREDIQGQVQSPATPATDPGTRDASEIGSSPNSQRLVEKIVRRSLQLPAHGAPKLRRVSPSLGV